MEIAWVILSVLLPLVATAPQRGLTGSQRDNERREPLTERPVTRALYYPGIGYFAAQAVVPAGSVGYYPGSTGYPGFGVYYPGGYNPSGGSYPGYYPAGGSYPGYYPNPGYNPNGGSPGYNPNGGSPGYNPNGGSPGYNPNGGSPGYNPNANNPSDDPEPEFSGEGGKIPGGTPVDNDVEVFEVPPNRRGDQPSGGYPGYPGSYPGYPGVYPG